MEEGIGGLWSNEDHLLVLEEMVAVDLDCMEGLENLSWEIVTASYEPIVEECC